MNLDPEQQKYIEQTARVHKQQKENWIVDALRVINEVISNPNVNNESLFWIRTWAVLVEYRKEIQSQMTFFVIDNFGDAIKKYSLTAGTGSFLAIKFICEMNTKLNEALNKLSEDELIVLDNLRQANCHIFQRGYEFKYKGHEIVKDKYRVEILQREFLINDLDSKIRNILLKYNLNNQQMAQDFAKKLVTPFQEIYELLYTFNRA